MWGSQWVVDKVEDLDEVRVSSLEGELAAPGGCAVLQHFFEKTAGFDVWSTWAHVYVQTDIPSP